MDAAQQTIITMDVAVGFGLLFSYSSAVAAVVMVEVVSVLATVDVDVATTMVIAANGLLFFLFSSAAAETMVPSANFFKGVVYAAPSYIDNNINYK